MATNPELLRVEESVKEKFLELVRNLSHLELKKFQKTQYAEMVFQDMSKLLPNFGKEQLKQTAHYVSNALNTEAKRELGERSRHVNLSKHRNTALLSSTVLEDLEETMLPDGEHENITDEGDDETGDLSSSFRQPAEPLDDSVTVMKQTIQSENKNENQPKTCNPNGQKNSKCCDSCQINQKNKKKS